MEFFRSDHKEMYAVKFDHYPWVVWADKDDIYPEKLDDRAETDFDHAYWVLDQDVPQLVLERLKSAAKKYRQINRKVGGTPPCYIRTEIDGGWEVAMAVRKDCKMSVEEAIKFAEENVLFHDTSHPIYKLDNAQEWEERFPQYSQFDYKEIILVGYNMTGFPGQKWSFRKAPGISGALARRFVEETLRRIGWGAEVPFPDRWK